MKFTKIYAEGGINGKADSTDYIVGYLAENSKRIDIEELINSPVRFYHVDGRTFLTLKEAKAFVESI